MSIEAMKQALEALTIAWLDEEVCAETHLAVNGAIDALRQAIATEESSAVQEPLSALLKQSRQNFDRNFGPSGYADWIYADLSELLKAHPQPKAEQEPKREPLTDKQIMQAAGDTLDVYSCARAIEAAHGIKGET